MPIPGELQFRGDLALAGASWAAPDNGAQPKLRALADSQPLLTTKAIARLRAFWDQFVQLPDSIAANLKAGSGVAPTQSLAAASPSSRRSDRTSAVRGRDDEHGEIGGALPRGGSGPAGVGADCRAA